MIINDFDYMFGTDIQDKISGLEGKAAFHRGNFLCPWHLRELLLVYMFGHNDSSLLYILKSCCMEALNIKNNADISVAQNRTA